MSLKHIKSIVLLSWWPMCVSVKGQEEDYVYFNLVVNVG